MAPISCFDKSKGLHSNMLLRSCWESRDIDQKAVGSHLPLGIRNSTPGGLGVLISNAGLSAPAPPAPIGTMPSVLHLSPQSDNVHRKLDRSHSEPVKQVLPEGGGRPNAPANSSRYKTELCRPYEENGFCKYGDKCQFAHGPGELRTMSRHPKYKTERCRTFHTTGLCPYGHRCHFIHNLDEGLNAGAPGITIQPKSSPPLVQLSYLFGGDDNPTPPPSLQGSPTNYLENFFDKGVSPIGQKNPFIDALTFGCLSPRPTNEAPLISPGGSSGESQMTELGHQNDLDLFPTLLGLDTPPTSPVESLAGDLDSLSISAPLNDMDISRSLRLPIFESLTTEH